MSAAAVDQDFSIFVGRPGGFFGDKAFQRDDEVLARPAVFIGFLGYSTAMFALAMVEIGVVVNRWNITLSGLVAPPDWSPGVLGNVVAVSYFPSIVEILVALGIVSYALLGFTLGVRYLEIYPHKSKAH